MMKIALLCIIIGIGYIQCNPMNISNSTNLPTDLPSIPAKEMDEDRMKFVSSPDVSQNISSRLDEKPADMNGYYSWLHFLKTSTSTQENHVNVSSKKT